MAKMFPRVRFTQTGYHRDQVEDFFDDAREDYEGQGQMTATQVRTAAFDLVRGGYQPAVVDEALDRIEAAVAARGRASFLEHHGQAAWMDEVAQRATVMYPRLTRPAGERFKPPAKGKGYDREAVDAVMSRLVDFFDSGRPLASQDLRTVTFPQAPRDRAYGEGPVDAFIDRAIDILLAVE